ncbi:MAG: alpha/beta hydrolase [Pseudolabrys sp.]|jgi:arylformamidase
MAVDYETEYDNRARVPEHPQIFARWDAEAAAWRAASPKAQIGLSYGPSKRQTIDLFPGKDAGPDAPLALFIHGGWWRSLEPSKFSQMAKGPNAHGVTVAVVGYDLTPAVSVAQIIEQIRVASLSLWHSQKKRFVAYGHSAGGHLAACMVATDWKTLDPSAPADLVPAGYGISGVYDATVIPKISANADIRLDEKSAREVSPLYWRVPAGRVFDAAVGGIESAEFLRQSKDLAEAWRQDNAMTRYEEIAGANHFTAIDPLTDPKSAMTQRVVELARQVAAITLS